MAFFPAYNLLFGAGRNGLVLNRPCFFDEASGINAGAFQKIDITKDNDDFLWVLQSIKVQRYDGKNAVDFIFNENLGSIFCDQQGIERDTSDTRVCKLKKEKK